MNAPVGSSRLAEYDAMRSFDGTPEPSGQPVAVGPDGAVALDGRRRFVAQLHRATRTHVDVRLEHAGVLLSWAVPKGPSLDPRHRRLAVRTEDHPFAYRWFEGVIGEGYGAGDVIVWDDGWWEPDPEVGVDEALERGKLSFTLHGERVRGGFVLVATGGDQWLLMKRRDDEVVPGWRADEPWRSVLTGRTNDEVVAGVAPRWPAPTADELAALDDLGPAGEWDVGGRTVALTILDKVLLPPRTGSDASPPVTKRDLVRYLTTMAPAFAPALVARPVNLTRFPDGPDGESFWQKAVPATAPGWLRRWPDPGARRGRTREYLVVDGPAALAWVANAAAIEIHPWTSTAMRPDEPSYALIDIDPGVSTAWDDTVLLAIQFRAALEHLGLVGVAKVTGKRGIQVWIPVRRGYGYDATRRFVERLSRAVGASVPSLVSWRWSTADRDGLARLDYTQNASNRTLVAPWSVRPAAGGPVSVPIRWEELDDPDLRPDRWTVATAPRRREEAGDPFAEVWGLDQDLPDL